MAINNRAFLSIFSVLTSFLNSSICVFSKPISFEFMIASNLQSLESQQNLIINRMRHQKLLMTHALVSADSRPKRCNFTSTFKIRHELYAHCERGAQGHKKRPAQRPAYNIHQKLLLEFVIEIQLALPSIRLWNL